MDRLSALFKNAVPVSFTGFGTSKTAPAFGSSTENNFAFPILIGVIAIAVIIVIIYVSLQPRPPGGTLVGPIDLFAPESPVIVARPAVASMMNASYSLSFYLFIEAVPDMRNGATPLLTWPGVWNLQYNPAQEQLNLVFGSNTIVIPNIPMQRWSQIVITFEGRTVDILINGALVRTHTLDNVPPASAASVEVVPAGIIGTVAIIQTWGKRLPVSDAAANYAATSDSRGRPNLGPDFINILKNISLPKMFCPSGDCGISPAANPSQVWEFPYA